MSIAIFAEVHFPLVLGRVSFKKINSVKFGRKVVIGDEVIIGKDVQVGSRVCRHWLANTG